MSVSILEANLHDNALAAGTVALLENGYDVIVLPEAHPEHDETASRHLAQLAEKNDYACITQGYGDKDRKDVHELAVLIKKDILVSPAEVIYMTTAEDKAHARLGRAALKAVIRDRITNKEISLLATHLDDRREATRQEQAESLLSNVSDEELVVVVGDLNTARSIDPRSLLLRGIGLVASRLPRGEPGTAAPDKKLSVDYAKHIGKRAVSIFARFGEMGSGGTLNYFLDRGFHDDDSSHRATMHNWLPLLKLDHILSRGSGLSVITTVRRHENKLSDHKRLEGYILIEDAAA